MMTKEEEEYTIYRINSALRKGVVLHEATPERMAYIRKMREERKQQRSSNENTKK